jgi:hypothetical protein
MGFKAFLQVSCQLVDQKTAEADIGGFHVFFTTTPDGWIMSTQICSRGRVPLALLNSIALAHLSVFEKRGIFLERDSSDGMLYLIKKTKPLHQYEDFQNVVKEYIKFCTHWKSILDDVQFSYSDFSLKEG